MMRTLLDNNSASDSECLSARVSSAELSHAATSKSPLSQIDYYPVSPSQHRTQMPLDCQDIFTLYWSQFQSVSTFSHNISQYNNTHAFEAIDGMMPSEFEH